MAVDFKNSETKDNLMRAFAGESQARNRYTFAAGVAKEQKQQAIGQIFLYTADQEKEHAEIFYNHLKELAREHPYRRLISRRSDRGPFEALKDGTA